MPNNFRFTIFTHYTEYQRLRDLLSDNAKKYRCAQFLSNGKYESVDKIGLGFDFMSREFHNACN